MARGFEIGHVAQVQQVETAIGDDQFFSGGTDGRLPRRQFIPRDDFLAEIHTLILPTRRGLATTLTGGPI